MDHAAVTALNHLLARNDGLEDPISLYEKLAELLFAGALVLAFVRREWRLTVVMAGASAALGLAVAFVLAHVVDRARPFVADPRHVHLFFPHATDSSFPSDHSTAAFAIAVAVLLRHRAAGIVVLVAAALVAVGRVAIGVHYPSDVLAGAAIGTGAAYAVRAVLPLAERRLAFSRG